MAMPSGIAIFVCTDYYDLYLPRADFSLLSRKHGKLRAMKSDQSVIGVDGGGSNTRAVWIGRDGSVLGTARAGGSNYQEVGIDGLTSLLRDLLMPWLFNDTGYPPVCICLGLAGAGRPAEQQAITQAVNALGWADKVRVESDARTALAGAHAGKEGIIALAGTGSMVLGVGRDGHGLRAGGWGPLLGDEGSGYDIALQGIRAALAAHDGSGPETDLSGALLAELKMEGWTEIVARVYGGDLDRSDLAALAPCILRCAECGDGVARKVVRSTAERFAGQIAAVVRRLKIDRKDGLSYGGGLFTGSSFLRSCVENALQSSGVGLRLMPVRLPAVLGAVVLAWERVGIELDESDLVELESVATSLVFEA